MSAVAEHTDQDAAHLDENVEQHLTFIVENEEYAVDILRVQGIQGWDRVTPIPNTPDHILGVINLRGSVMPVVDLRSRFGLPRLEFGPTTVVIIVRVQDEDKERVVGMVVDAVSEVYNVPQNTIQPTPEFGPSVDTRFISGITTVEDKMVILLDIDKLLSIEDTRAMDAHMAQASSSEDVEAA